MIFKNDEHLMSIAFDEISVEDLDSAFASGKLLMIADGDSQFVEIFEV